MNNIAVSTVTSKGQITIPKEIRDRLRLQAGHRVEFQIDRQGQ
jgi:AbrB family looped-hinge helix DNA binding protein